MGTQHDRSGKHEKNLRKAQFSHVNKNQISPTHQGHGDAHKGIEKIDGHTEAKDAAPNDEAPQGQSQEEQD